MRPKTLTHDRGYSREVRLGRFDERYYESLHKKEITIRSKQGYPLFGMLFNNNSNNTVIICHGISLNLFSSIKYLPMYYNRGFNVLVYDHRNHGKSGGKTTTYGYYEKYDLKLWVQWVKKYYGDDSKIGIHGESMGASTVIQYAAIEDIASFYVVDCPFSDLKRQIKIRAKADYKIPSFPILYICNLIYRFINGVYFDEISPIGDVSHIKAPMLFIHGAEDNYVPTEMTIDLYNKKKGIKSIYISPNSGHTESYINNKKEYEEILDSFLNSF